MTAMTRSRAFVIVTVVVIVAGLVLLMVRMRRDSEAQPGAARPARVPVAARIVAIYPGSGEKLTVTVRLFNHIARQTLSTNAALDAAGSQAPRRPIEPVTVSIAAAEWATAVRFQGRDGAAVPASSVRVVRSPAGDSHVLDGSAIVHALFEIGAEAAAALNGQVRAVVSINGWTVESNAVELTPPATERDRLVRRARAAEASGDWTALLAAGDALAGSGASSYWAPWFRGLALEGMGRRDDALAAYEAAAAALPPPDRMQEPPIELFRRVAALRPSR